MTSSDWDNLEYFSESYNEARSKFCKAAIVAGAKLETLSLSSEYFQNDFLSTDIAWLGNPKPRNVILHSSGLHGVEGFAGSAIQTYLLNNPPLLDDKDALVIVHCLNPYGMKNLRRVNSGNVDLNRNFLLSSDEYFGSSEIYNKINYLLNPDSLPTPDLFFLKTLVVLLKYGFTPVKQAVASGQYDFPKGLFFGGKEIQEELINYNNWLLKNLDTARYILAIDVHTGLGGFGKEVLLVEDNVPHFALEELKHFFGQEKVREQNPNKSIGYNINGSISRAMPQLLSWARVDFLTQEFGTFLPISCLFALREENRIYHYGKNNITYSSIKNRFKEAFYPSSNIWRKKIIFKGVQLIYQAVKFISQHVR